MQVFHTPGHSPGSISLFLHSEGVLFSGDAIPVAGDLPVYDDALASVQSIRRLRGINGIHTLLSAWDEPKKDALAYQRMDDAIGYLQKIHETVIAAAGDDPLDLMELTRKVAEQLNLPPQAVNPLLARTFSANLRARDVPDLIFGPSA